MLLAMVSEFTFVRLCSFVNGDETSSADSYFAWQVGRSHACIVGQRVCAGLNVEAIRPMLTLHFDRHRLPRLVNDVCVVATQTRTSPHVGKTQFDGTMLQIKCKSERI